MPQFPTLRARVEHDFTYHQGKPEDLEKFAAITVMTRNLALDLVALCPEGRDLSLALTHLEDVRMRANAAIVKG